MKPKKVNRYFLFLPIIPLLGLFILRHLGFDGLYGMDSYEYLRYSGSMKAFLLGGEHPGAFFWPKGYPLLVAIFSFLMPVSLAGQVVSLASLYGVFYFSYRISQRLYQTPKNNFAFLAIALFFAPYLLRNGVQVMSDLLAVFCLVATVYYSLCFASKKELKPLIACAFFAMYGAFTRYGILIPLLPVFFFVGYYFIKNFRLKFLLAFLLPVLITVLHIYFEAGGSEFSKHHFIEEWSFGNYFKRTFSSTEEINLASFTYTFPNVLYYFGFLLHPGFFFLNVVLLLFSFKSIKEKKRQAIVLLIAIVVLNSLFLSGVTYQGDRYLFPAYPFFIILLVPAFSFFIGYFNKFRIVVLLALVAIQLSLSIRTIYPSFERNTLEKEVVEVLQNMQNETLYCFEMDLALQQRGLNFKYKNLWTQEYDEFQAGALVLFNPAKFEKRFEGKTPMLNWNKLESSYELKKIHQFRSGWVIYRVYE